MTILYIVAGIILILWLISKLLIFLIEVWTEHSLSRSVHRKQRAVEQNNEKQRRAEETALAPLVKRYQKSPFLAELIDHLASLNAFDRRYPIGEFRLDRNSITLYQHNETTQTLYFNELGYQPLPDDKHLKAVACVLHSRLGDDYREDICYVDLALTHIPINYIRLIYEQPPVHSTPFLKQTL